MGNYILLHGLNESLTQTWGNYLKAEIEKMNGKVYMPELAKGHETSYEHWKENVDELYNKGLINEKTTIVAHSLSTNFMISYLLEKKCKINTFIAVAGYSDFLDKEVERKSSINKIITPFMNTEEERKAFSKMAKYRYAIYSNMDKMFKESNLEKYAIDMKAHRMVLDFGGHFDESSKVKEVPFIVDIIKDVNIKNRKNYGRVVYIGQEKGASETTIHKYEEVKDFLSTKYRYVTTPLRGIEYTGVETDKFRKYTDLIKNSDLVIVDVSSPSIEVGVEMMIAISMQIPILVVAKSSVSIPDIVSSIWRIESIKRFKNTKDLLDIIKGCIR